MSSPASNLDRQSAKVVHLTPPPVTDTIAWASAAGSAEPAATAASASDTAQSYAWLTYRIGAWALSAIKRSNNARLPVVAMIDRPSANLGSLGNAREAMRGSNIPSSPSILSGVTPAPTRPLTNSGPSARLTRISSVGLVLATRCGRSPNDVAAAG